jgi:hypothetical protein
MPTRWYEKILDGCCWLICGFENFKPTCVDCCIYHCECKQRNRECILDGVLIVNEPTRSIQTMTQGYSVRFWYFGWEQPIFLTLLLYNQCSISCVRPGHVMVFLIVFSNLFCPRWSQYSWYQDSTLCFMSQWLRNVDLFFVAKNSIPFNMLYWVMRLG